jgi:hypothetical protein
MIKIRKHNERKAERERQARELNTQQISPSVSRPKLTSRPSNGGLPTHSPSPVSQNTIQHPTSPANTNVSVAVAPPHTPQKSNSQTPSDRLTLKPSNSSLGSLPPQTPNKTNGGPLSHLTAPRTTSNTLQAGPTSKEHKRRSINPGLTLSNPLSNNTVNHPAPTFSPALSPMSAQFAGRSSSPTGRTSMSSRGSIASFYQSPASSVIEDDTITRPLPSPNSGRSPRPSPRQNSFSKEEKRDSQGSTNRPASRVAVPHSIESASEDEPDIDTSAYGLEPEPLPPPPPSKGNENVTPPEDHRSCNE